VPAEASGGWQLAPKPSCDAAAAEAERDIPALGDRQRQEVIGADGEGLTVRVPTEDNPLTHARELRA
jgi:hypothetical protein